MQNENDSLVTTTETVEVKENTQNQETVSEKTYSRSELNKIVNAEKEKARNNAIEEYKAQQSEAERLAKMNSDEKHEYEMKKKDEELSSVNMKLHTYEMQKEASNYANETGLNLTVLKPIDGIIGNLTAEDVKGYIDNVNDVINKEVERKLNERLKEKSPFQVKNNSLTTNQEYLKNKYGNNPYYRG